MGPAEDEVASKNKKVSCNFTDGKFTMLARGGFTLNYYAPYTYFKIQPHKNGYSTYRKENLYAQLF